MNKTVNINLGGMFFHIDEDAYQKLSRYFDAIKRSLSNSSGQDEIIKDIEMRVSELLNEKQKSEKHVVSVKDVDEVIAVMGQPEDYRIDDEATENKSTGFSSTTASSSTLKKLYRDKDNGMIGGVLAGLSHYFGIDKVWLRIAFIALIWLFGTGVLAYIVLWIVMPEAVTTAEKLEMTGEPVNISNIEKKVREEFDNVSEKIKNVDYDKVGNQVKYTVGKAGSSFGDFIIAILRIFAKFMGALIIIIASVALIALIISLFTLGSTSFLSVPWLDYFNTFNYTNTAMWFISLLFFLVIGIPVFMFLLLGLKILVSGTKSIGNIAKYTLLALWIIATAALIYIGVHQATEVAFEGKTVQKQTITINPTDTLFVKFKYNDYYTKDVKENESFKFVQDSANNQLIYSNNITLKVMRTEEKHPYIQIEKIAKGRSFSEAKQRAEKIKYDIKIEGNHLILDNYLLTEVANKYRGQEVALFLYLPEGTLLKPDASVEDYDESDNDYFNMHFSSDKYVYKVGANKVKCLNCPKDEDEYNDVDIDTLDNIDIQTPNVTINKEGISIKNDSAKSHNKDFKELKINKDGIIIKTK